MENAMTMEHVSVIQDGLVQIVDTIHAQMLVPVTVDVMMEFAFVIITILHWIVLKQWIGNKRVVVIVR